MAIPSEFMNLLLTNDDGWDADGLGVLQEVARSFGNVWVVAPALPMSGISHQITFERPLKLEERGDQIYSLTGTPADCVRIATTQLNQPFDWVLSGINNGANLGSDIYVSGTFAAAREAALRSNRAIALSQHRRKFNAEFDWGQTQEMAARVLQMLLEDGQRYPAGRVVNVNFPDRYHLAAGQPERLVDAAMIDCELDPHPLPADFEANDQGEFVYRSQYDQRARADGGDIAVCFGGNISMTYFQFGKSATDRP